MPELHSGPSFDFDAWAALASNNPQAFEAKRNDVLEEAILQAPVHQQPRLRRLQWKLDQIHRTAANPLAATLRMQELMWESVTGEDGLLARLQHFQGAESPDKNTLKPAKILQFSR